DRGAGEHRIDPLAQAAFLRELDEQTERLVGDPVLGVVEIDVLGLDGEALATVAVLREQVAQVEVADLVGMPCKRLPGAELAERVDPCGHSLSSSIRPLRAARACERCSRAAWPTMR